MLYNADLHIHSKHSIGTSGAMDIETLARESPRKGISLLGAGDCLHPEWLKEIRESCELSDGILSKGKVHFILQTEVEDNHRVHHIIFFPEFSSVEGFIEALKGRHSALTSDGRPKMHMGGLEIAQAALDNEAMVGPSHAFTPWTGMYAHHDSLVSCYGDLADKVHFAELGLSADSDYADRIPEMRRLTFLTNSDAHSPYPTKLAREFNRIEMKAPSFAELRKAIMHEGGRKFVLNVGLPPQEGKYNESACIKCLTHYGLGQAKALRWRCTCGGVVKKGVRDRVEELSDSKEPKHPAHRPPYLHLIPLGEIITKALGIANPNSKKVDEAWASLVGKFGNEVAVLVDAPIDAIEPKEVAEAIAAFREGRVRLIPGGGGQYGQVVLGDEKVDLPKVSAPTGQRGLFEFNK